METKNIFNANKIKLIWKCKLIYQPNSEYWSNLWRCFFSYTREISFKQTYPFLYFINYFDDGNSFSINELEICCLPHNESVKNDFNSNIIQNFKTYKYLKENQASKLMITTYQLQIQNNIGQNLILVVKNIIMIIKWCTHLILISYWSGV